MASALVIAVGRRVYSDEIKEMGVQTGKRNWEASRVSPESWKGFVFQVGKILVCLQAEELETIEKVFGFQGEKKKYFLITCSNLTTQ